MISVETALKLIRDHQAVGPNERVPLAQALGRILAQDVVSPYEFPMFDNSAMDGFAVGSPEGPWEIVGEVAAGVADPLTLLPLQAVRIFTGAPTPGRTYGVIPQEDASVQSEMLMGTVHKGAHVRYRAEEISVGHLIAQKGVKLTPPHLAAFASCGMEVIEVLAAPRVTVLSTGNEVVAPGKSLQFGQIFNSNATAIASALALQGICANVRHAEDCHAELSNQIHESIESSDLLITTGGISVGAHDLVRAAIEEEGFQMKFHGVAVKPGKPIAFGTREDGKAWFGLPGNPLSTWVGYLVFVSAWLRCESPRELLPVALNFEHKPGRDEFLPAERKVNGEVMIKRIVGSHANFGLLECDGMVRVPHDQSSLKKGDQIEFLSFPWSRAR